MRSYGVRMDIEEARQALGNRITELREEQNISLRRFALMVNLSKDYMVDLEKGRKSPTLDTIVKISAGFGITPAQLLHGIAGPEPGDENPAPEYYHTRL